MSRVICVKPCVPNFGSAITIPYVGTIKPIAEFDLKSDCSGCGLLTSLFSQVSPFVMSMGIPLCALGCLGSLVAFAKAVPASLGPPPDPSQLATALANIAIKCKCVLESALPPPAGPICQFLKFVSGTLGSMVSLISCANVLVGHLAVLAARATNYLLNTSDPSYPQIGACLNQEVNQMLSTMVGKINLLSFFFAAMQGIFDLINAIVPIPELADIANAFSVFNSSTSSPSLANVVAALSTLSASLTTVASAVATVASVCP